MPRGRRLRALLAVLVLLTSALAGATSEASPVRAGTPCTPETEPNDAPEQAHTFSGAACFSGTLPDGDQDLFIWELDAADAAKRWTLSLTGVPQTITGLKLLPITSDPGVTPVLTGAPVIELDTALSAPGPITRRNLLIPAGRYVLGVSRSGTSSGVTPPTVDYQFSVAEGDAIPPNGDTEPNEDAQHASPVHGDFSLSGDLSGSVDEYAWTVSKEDAARAWSLEADGQVGVSMYLSLEKPDGTVLTSQGADNDGRASLTDLKLASGKYIVRVEPAADTPRPYVLTAAATSNVIGDPEPNDTAATAVPLDPSHTVAQGRIGRTGDRDTYGLRVSDTLATTLLDIKLIWHSGLERRVCLLDASDAELGCRSGTQGVVLGNLLLPAGNYTIAVTGDPSLRDLYLLRVDTTSAPAPDFETEPNDSAALGSAWDPAVVMRGRMSVGDSDFFRVSVAGTPQLWQLDATGTNIERVEWVSADGTQLSTAQVSADGTSATLVDMYLIPGDHWVRITGDGEYNLHLTALGPPDPNGERESNNDAVHAEPIRLGQTRIGRLAQDADADVYRFSLQTTEHVLIHIDPPADGGVAFRLETGSTTVGGERSPALGAPIVYDAMLLPGDYDLWLTPGPTSATPYTLKLERGDPFTTSADQEPNNAIWMANGMPASQTVSGNGTPSGDDDWFRLQPLQVTGSLAIHAEGSLIGLGLSDGTSDLTLTPDADGVTYRAEGLPQGVPLYLRVSSTGAYTVSIVSGELPSAVPGTLPVSLALTTSQTSVAAYWLTGQRVDGQLTINNTGTADENLTLDALTSHFAWSVELGQTTVSVPAGGSVTVPLTIHALADAWADEPVRISVRAMDGSGAQQTASVEIESARDQAAVNPEQGWSVPAALLGGLDVASTGLGGAAVPMFDPVAEAQLYDGVTPAGGGFVAPVSTLPVTLTSDLAGTDSVPVAGIILNPQAGDGFLTAVPRTFDLLLSTDGVTYQQVLSGTLSPLPIDQPFVLSSPVPATFAQLRITSVYGNGVDHVALGEWKVVATPGVVPTAGPLNIADPSLGGHVVWMDPQSGDPAFAEQILSEDPTRETLRVTPGTKPQWVVGFQDDRAAQVTELQWVDPPGSDPNARFTSVDVAVSLDSPVGPWKDIGTWKLDRAGGTVASFAVDGTVWARFVRFTGNGPAKAATDWEEPATLRIIEQATGADYESAFAEWGQVDRAGIYEKLNPPDLTAPADTPGDNNTPQTADPLASGDTATGRVQNGQHIHWYAVTVPDGQNTLTFTLGGSPFVGAGLTLLDSAGSQVPMTFKEGAQPGTVEYTADVSPGSTYDIEVDQPPFSSIFTYDTSISISAYEPFVKEAIGAFGASVVPGREAVKIFPFEDPSLLLDWSDQPYVLENAADNAVDKSLSSSAEAALLSATAELSSREGARAVLMVTDAETSSYDKSTELWSKLASARPLVFTVHIGGNGEPVQSRHFMQDWAASAGGFYQYARTHDDVDRAFDRMATWLRRPAGYSLTFATTFVKPPPPSNKPGSLKVVGTNNGDPSKVPVGANVAIEIILDTSGSMLDKLEGKRRIDIAQSVLTHLVQDKLPVGVPLALRVFGDTPSSCDTRLAVPLKPLDPAELTAQIQGLHILASVNTPIGAALKQVASDLAGVTGPKIVVLVTDGAENCGGNPGKAVKDLARGGVDVHVNIVGFALDQKSIKKQLAGWAKSGHGSYYNATGTSDLNQAVAQAVSAPFRVLDEAGTVVATGTVNGAPLQLKPGTYTVDVLTDPQVTFTAVVEAGNTLELTLPSAPATP